MGMPMLKIKDLFVSRLVMGGNPISGFSHANPKRTTDMLDYFTAENTKKLFRECEKNGINTVFLRADNHIIRILREYWNEGGKLQWFAQTLPGEDTCKTADNAKTFGASGCYLHGGTMDSVFKDGKHEEVRKELEYIKKLGMPAGVASHDPANLLEVEKRGWNPDFYMACLYNIPGYMGKLSVEQHEKFKESDRKIALDAIKQIKKPCFAYKILAAGRKKPREAFKEVLENIKPIDGVTVGMFPPDAGDIVKEDAALVEEFS